MPVTDLKEILAEAQELERKRPFLAFIHLILPPAILLTALCMLALAGRLAVVATLAATSFFTVGKLIILWGPAAPLSANELALMVIFLDIWVAYLLAFNLHYLYRIPRVGPALERLQNYCSYWMATQPWMRRWAFTGVMLFVMFPLTGTGAPGGSILGRLLGLSAATTLCAIALGAVLGSGLMAAFAAQLEPVFHDIQHTWWFELSGVLILAIVVLLLYRLGRRLSRAADDYARTRAAEVTHEVPAPSSVDPVDS